MRRMLPGVVVAAALIILFLVYRGGPGDVSTASGPGASMADGKSTGRQSSEAVLSIAPGAKRTPSQVPKASVSPLMQEYASQRFKDLYTRLRSSSSPSPEEKFVLARILERCAKIIDRNTPDRQTTRMDQKVERERFVASLSGKDPNREKRIAAYDKAMIDPCAGLDGITSTDKEIRELLASAAASGDPKARAVILTLDMREARRTPEGYDYSRQVWLSDAQVEEVKAIMMSGDPRALVDVVELFDWLAGNQLRGPDDAPIDGMVLHYAATLAACDLGYPCGPDQIHVVQGCAVRGQCDAADYRDYILYYGLSPGMSQQVMQVQSQLVEVARSGNWHTFTIYRGPSPFSAITQH